MDVYYKNESVRIYYSDKLHKTHRKRVNYLKQFRCSSVLGITEKDRIGHPLGHPKLMPDLRSGKFSQPVKETQKKNGFDWDNLLRIH